MSECVVRMEKPTSCDDCDIADRFGNEIYCPFLGWYADYDKCPVFLQLPEGHGRLIDADAMAKDLNYDVELDAKALDDMSIVGYARERFQFDKNRKQDCIRYLSGQKTIVPAEAERSE